MTDDITDFIRASREIKARDGGATYSTLDVQFEYIAYACTNLPRALDMLEAQQRETEKWRDARDELARARRWDIDKLERQMDVVAEQLVVALRDGDALRKQLAEQQSRMDEALTNQRRTLAAETDEALAKLAKVQADASAKLAEQQAEITRLTDDLKHIAYNISLSVPPGYNDAESFYRAGLMSAINRAAWAVSPKDKP